MDYRTLFLTHLASLLVYSVFAGSLALRNRKVHGLGWLAGGLFLTLIKVILQGLEGRIPTILSSLVANELYLFSFVLQMLGLRWFVDRRPIQHRWPLYGIILLATLYMVLYLGKVPYIASLINVPAILILATTAWIILVRGKGLFLNVSRWTAVFLYGEIIVSAYRAVLTHYHYFMPWKVSAGQLDPRWVYSLMAMMLFSTCVLMCDIWFFVVELQCELIQQARTDALTGALNRRALFEEADREISRSIRTSRPLSVLLLDVDNFKAMNDTRGHAAGDFALQWLVTQLKAILRTQDRLARSGGEEFTIILPETDITRATAVAERIRSTIHDLDIPFETASFHTSVSIGIAEMTPACLAFDVLLQHADAAMYAAKRSGKNRIVAYSNELTGQASPSLSSLISSRAEPHLPHPAQ